MSRPIAVSIFASTAIACAAYLAPQILALRLNRKIIENNDEVRRFLSETGSSGIPEQIQGDGLFGSYL